MRATWTISLGKLEKFTMDFVKSDFLKSQNLSFFKSHLRVFGIMIPRNFFSENIFCQKYLEKKIFLTIIIIIIIIDI